MESEVRIFIDRNQGVEGSQVVSGRWWVGKGEGGFTPHTLKTFQEFCRSNPETLVSMIQSKLSEQGYEHQTILKIGPPTAFKDGRFHTTSDSGLKKDQFKLEVRIHNLKRNMWAGIVTGNWTLGSALREIFMPIDADGITKINEHDPSRISELLRRRLDEVFSSRHVILELTDPEGFNVGRFVANNMCKR